MGGTKWVQVAATYVIAFKDGTSNTSEELMLSTVHRTKDGRYLSYLLAFHTDPNIFDRMYRQVLPRIFGAFVFR